MLALAEMEALKRRLNQVICPVCTESKPGGSCGLKEPDQCPMWVQLPRLIEVTRAVQSTHMDPYIRKVREDVCPNCRALPDGHCEARDEGHCALDAYLLVIVRTIEDFLAELPAEHSQTNWLNQPLITLISHIVNKQVAWPRFDGSEMTDLQAYLMAAHKKTTGPH